LSQLAWAHPKAVTATAPAGASPRVAEERYGYPSDCRAERLLAVSSGKQVLYSPNFGKDMCSQVGLPLCCDSRKFIEPEDRPGEATHSLCSSYAPLGCRDAPRDPLLLEDVESAMRVLPDPLSWSPSSRFYDLLCKAAKSPIAVPTAAPRLTTGCICTQL
jgi:hypothetical protein